VRRWLCIAACLFASCSSSLAATPVAHRVRQAPVEAGTADVTVTVPTPARTAAHVAAPHVAPKPTPPRTADLAAFRRLGTWIDVFDYTNDPSSILPLVAQMSKLGTKTLYLETARSNSTSDIAFPASVAAALDAAKARGMRVVSWYPPDFANVGLDLHRSVVAAHFRTKHGNTFDGFASDIEYTGGVRDDALRSARTVQYSKALRAAVGRTYPLGAIVIPPTSLQINPTRWPNFPWRAMAPSYDVFMPMNYWTAHARNAATATDLTRRNVVITRSLTGKPVHIIGGLGEDSDVSQVRAYVFAARGAGSIGGSLYDFRTTASGLWGELRRFNA
jgi:hypothetical protein